MELSEGHVVGGNAHLCFFQLCLHILLLRAFCWSCGSQVISRRLLPSEHRHCRELRLDLGSSESFPRIGEFGGSQNPFQVTFKISLLLF